MADLLKKYGSKVKGFTRGEKIEAKLVEVNKKSALFDIGGKSEGVLIDDYFSEARDYLKTLKIGDSVRALVMDPETSEGNVILSLRHAAADSLWDKLHEAQSKEIILNVNVKNANQSGISIDYEGISGFIPSSQLSRNVLENIDNITGSLKVKVIEVDKSRKKVVFSERAVSEAKEIEEANKTLNAIKVSKIYNGVITTITSFGIFVKIKVEKKEIEGLVHISELSWDKIDKPTDSFKVGQKVDVKVLGVRDGKIALSIKQALEDPWDNINKKFKVEDRIKGTVVKNSDFGTFVRLAPGIEGLIHITKIPPATRLVVGDEVNCYIEEIDERNKKISLGLVLTSKPVAYK